MRVHFPRELPKQPPRNGGLHCYFWKNPFPMPKNGICKEMRGARGSTLEFLEMLRNFSNHHPFLLGKGRQKNKGAVISGAPPEGRGPREKTIFTNSWPWQLAGEIGLKKGRFAGISWGVFRS
ncbi:hypothetical protein TRVL_08792 [Trypanosoma vivax]|nr:hypothetical protein TRVL_08792 [Trypanosoma vivax]